MNLFDIFEESFLVLRTNKMRTGLSALGIIIGIASVITLMTLGQASSLSIKKQIQSLGANLLTIRPGNQNTGAGGFIRENTSNSKTLTVQDANAIATSKRITTITSVAMEYSARSQIVYEGNNENVSVTGVAGNYFLLRNIEIDKGVEISEKDNETQQKVAVLGPTTAENLFGENTEIIGKYIKIGGSEYKVIGVTKSKGEGGFGNLDSVAYIPLSTAQKSLFGVTHLSTIYVSAKNEDLMEGAKNQIGFLLLELHKKASPQEADFSINSQADILSTANSITGTFTTLLTGIAAISLIVGGIGIMNIMLVTVTERTSEIGLRKALGAKNKTVIQQFLVESCVLTILGGLTGILLGIGISLIITKTMSLPQIIAYESIALSFFVSAIIGIVFGLYPAIKASKLQPIEALRYE
ncbi:ABC transporter permease [Patescibacteria group bacterium]|nr:ABC transporter permease [Patescibacteria group bacterium]